jgi:phospholysine phosphohistidine inorganic pyrophosphate phosphatase
LRGVLIDLDGVIWEGDNVVPGAPATVEWLNAQGIPHVFVTNTTSRPRRLIAAKLARLGIAAEAGQILTPPLAARQWLAANVEGPVLLLVPPATEEDFPGLAVADRSGALADVGAIVVGDIGDAWSYALLNKAFRLLMRESPPRLLALGMTRYWRAADGLRLDVGPFIKALEHAAGCKAVVLGKPSAEFFAIALDRIGCEASETVMIGDDIQADVRAAQDVGLKGVLVKTGKFRPQDLAGPAMPDATLDSIAGLPDWWRAAASSGNEA